MMNIALDLETASRKPNAAILSIGAVVFDPTTPFQSGIEKDFHKLRPSIKPKKEFYRNVNLQSCMDLGLATDGDTFYWWLKQSENARKALLPDRIPIKKAVQDFLYWFRSLMYVEPYGINENTPIWTNMDFDAPILRNAIYQYYLEEDIPCSYRVWRDLRTLKELAVVKGMKEEDYEAGREAIRQDFQMPVEEHNALVDANLMAFKVKYLISFLEKV